MAGKDREIGSREDEELDLISYTQVKELTGLPIGTLYALVSQGRIPHVRLGKRLVRFSRRKIRNWVAGNAVPVRGGRP